MTILEPPSSQSAPAAATIPADGLGLEIVAQLAREFWEELSTDRAATAGDGARGPTVDETALPPSLALPGTGLPFAAEPTPPVAVGTTLDQAGNAVRLCTSVANFDALNGLGAIGQTVDVAELIRTPGGPTTSGYPGTVTSAFTIPGMPGDLPQDLGNVPYYLHSTPALEPQERATTVPVGIGRTAPSPQLTRVPYFLQDTSLGQAPPSQANPIAPPSIPGTIARARLDFPILNEVVNGKRLVWLDNAATTQKPNAVIDRLRHFYEHENSNIHRAAHTLAARSTDAYEQARNTLARFINAGSADSIVFVRGATEAINLVAQTWGRKHITAGDEIVITWLEHHSNIVPWQQLTKEIGATLRVAPVDSRGQILLNEYERLLGPRTKLVAMTHVSNALGTVLPVHEMAAAAHRHGAKVLIDGAQSISHMPIDVRALDPDFFVISGHKVFAPTGIGALYGKPEVLASMPPWQGGGNMIADVTFERTVFMPPPMRFEAGTGNIADAIGMGAALEYLEQIGMPNVAIHEHNLIEYATSELLKVPGLRIVGTAAEKAGVVSFVLANRSTADLGAALAAAGIAVRAGHHCAQPALRRFGLEATVRPSFALYNHRDDIDALVSVVKDLA